MTMNPRTLILALPLALLATACSGSDGSAGRDAEGRTIEVTMTDALRFDPDVISVTTGETVRFEVTNEGEIVHEFLIGDEAAQAAFAEDMASDMNHDSAAGVSVEPGQTETFAYTFGEASDTLAGCHEPGHYEGGMVATITVTD